MRADLRVPAIVASVAPGLGSDWMHLFPLRQNGALAMHDVCGADLADKLQDRSHALFDMLSAAGTPAGAIAKGTDQ